MSLSLSHEFWPRLSRKPDRWVGNNIYRYLGQIKSSLCQIYSCLVECLTSHYLPGSPSYLLSKRPENFPNSPLLVILTQGGNHSRCFYSQVPLPPSLAVKQSNQWAPFGLISWICPPLLPTFLFHFPVSLFRIPVFSLVEVAFTLSPWMWLQSMVGKTMTKKEIFKNIIYVDTGWSDHR